MKIAGPLIVAPIPRTPEQQEFDRIAMIPPPDDDEPEAIEEQPAAPAGLEGLEGASEEQLAQLAQLLQLLSAAQQQQPTG